MTDDDGFPVERVGAPYRSLEDVAAKVREDLRSIQGVFRAGPEADTNTSRPRGTYGCACVSSDARNCVLQRYGWCGHYGSDENCQCLCHQWDDDDES